MPVNTDTVKTKTHPLRMGLVYLASRPDDFLTLQALRERWKKPLSLMLHPD
jgi:hypothetical protein